MNKVLIATGNEGKKKEMLAFFKDLEKTEWVSLSDFPPIREEPEENGEDFEENALIKARFFAKRFQVPTLGEDSGIILEALPEKFGIKTRREIDAKTDVDWLRIFLEMMEEQENRKATFYSALAFFDPETRKEYVVRGQTPGEITEFPQAPLEKGIPISSVFIPDGESDVYSAMSKQQKNEVSHRGKACREMAKFLLTL